MLDVASGCPTGWIRATEVGGGRSTAGGKSRGKASTGSLVVDMAGPVRIHGRGMDEEIRDHVLRGKPCVGGWRVDSSKTPGWA